MTRRSADEARHWAHSFARAHHANSIAPITSSHDDLATCQPAVSVDDASRQCRVTLLSRTLQMIVTGRAAGNDAHMFLNGGGERLAACAPVGVDVQSGWKMQPWPSRSFRDNRSQPEGQPVSGGVGTFAAVAIEGIKQAVTSPCGGQSGDGAMERDEWPMTGCGQLLKWLTGRLSGVTLPSRLARWTSALRCTVLSVAEGSEAVLMGGFRITSRETSMLADIVDLSRQPSDQPLSGSVLDLVQHLLHAEWVTFVALDSTQPRIRFLQGVGPDGEHTWESETIAEARKNPFWQRYWDPDKGCGYADRTGDYTFVRRASDCQSLRQRRARGTSDEELHDRLIQACLPAESRGRYSRVTAFRDGLDFTEKDLLFLTLLQPHLHASYTANAAARRGTPTLTQRQMDIMRMVRAGLSNRQIARRTGLSEGTVHSHLTNIYARLDVQSRTEALHAVFNVVDDWDNALA